MNFQPGHEGREEQENGVCNEPGHNSQLSWEHGIQGGLLQLCLCDNIDNVWQCSWRWWPADLLFPASQWWPLQTSFATGSSFGLCTGLGAFHIRHPFQLQDQIIPPVLNSPKIIHPVPHNPQIIPSVPPQIFIRDWLPIIGHDALHICQVRFSFD